MTSDLIEALSAQLRLLEQAAQGPRAVGLAKQTSAELAATRSAEAQRNPGVYVYSLPIYLAHPVEADTKRTLLKVGHSAVDVFCRVATQSRTTALPEDPILLRVYPCEASARVEAQFHDSLARVGHLRPGITSYAGKEWFLTTVDFLDELATDIGLQIQVVNNP